VQGIATTSPTRTVIDLASLGDESVLVLAFDDALRRGMTSVPELLEQLQRFGPVRPGTKLMERVLDRRIGGAIPASGKESMFDELVRLAGLPAPVRQYEVFRDDRVLIGRADFAYPDYGVLIEIQTVRHHGSPEDQVRDNRRHAAFASAGYRVLPIWTSDLNERPSYVAALIRDALAQ
jgi:very-short-patch-repair endonuclease